MERSYIVWTVYGMVRGNITKLVTLPYSDKRLADRIASAVRAGYVLRDRASREPSSADFAAVVRLADKGTTAEPRRTPESGVRLGSVPMTSEEVARELRWV